MSRFDSQRFRKLRFLIEQSLEADEEERLKFARCMEPGLPREEVSPSSLDERNSIIRSPNEPVEETQSALPDPLSESTDSIGKERKKADIGEAIKTAKKETLLQLAHLSETYSESNRDYHRSMRSSLSGSEVTIVIRPTRITHTGSLTRPPPPIDGKDDTSLPSLSPSSTLISEGDDNAETGSKTESPVVQWGRLVNGHGNETSSGLRSRCPAQSHQGELQSDRHLSPRDSIDDDAPNNPSAHFRGTVQPDRRMNPRFHIADDSPTNVAFESDHLQERQTLDSAGEQPNAKCCRSSPVFTTLPALIWAFFLWVLLFPEFFQADSVKTHHPAVRDFRLPDDQQPDLVLFPNATSESASDQPKFGLSPLSSMQCFRPPRDIFQPLGSLPSRPDHTTNEPSLSIPTKEKENSSKSKLQEQPFREGTPCRFLVCRLARRLSRSRRRYQSIQVEDRVH